MLHGMKALFIISYDAYAQIAVRIARECAARGAQAQFLLLSEQDGGTPFFAQEQLAPLEAIGPIHISGSKNLIQQATAAQADVVFILLAGELTYRLPQALHSASPEMPPVCITTFPGIASYRQHVGFSQRVTSDILLLNSPWNMAAYRQFCKHIGASDQNGFILGFSALLGRKARTSYKTVPERVMYVDQNIIPRPHRQRLQLARQLLNYAQQFPARELIIQCREHEGNRTAHPLKHSLVKLLHTANQGKPLPQNIRINYHQSLETLETCDLCISFCSTLLIHAIACNIPVAVLTDFGMRKSSGLFYFDGSGLQTNFAELLAGKNPPPPNAAWLEEYITFPEARLEALFARILELHAMPQRGVINSKEAARYWRRQSVVHAIRRPLGIIRRKLFG
jgi:hypothetical protein